MLAACSAWADTIVLKNGNRIVADSVTETGDRIEYTIGDNTFVIPKSSVLRIESGGTPASHASEPVPAGDLPAAPVIDGTADLRARLIHGGTLDLDALHAIDAEGIADKAAAANSIAAEFEQKRNNIEQSARYIERALKWLPDNPVLLEDYTSVLLQLGRNSDALSYAERATRAEPQSADAWELLGYACYRTDRTAEAIGAWKKSISLHPDEKVKDWIAKAERESSAEAGFRQQQSEHFVLRFAGTGTTEALRQQILDVLEAEYRDLQNDLGASPRNITVSLYPEEKFFDVTQAPSWSAGLNDGKIRIPLSGVTAVTPELQHILRHELTHSFVNYIVHGRAPQWLNEGVAELEQGLSTNTVSKNLTALYASGRQIPLNQLEGDFMQYSPNEASVAYAEALAAVEYVRNTYGMTEIAGILHRIGDGQSPESALRTTIHGGYAQMETDITQYLSRRYGQ